MANCCDTPNPLIRDGVSQRQRQIAALLPNSIKLDEQDLADFLVFAYRLSQQIIYYRANLQPNGSAFDPTDNQPDGNWQSFFTNSVPVHLARISKIRTQPIRDAYTRQLEQFLGDRTPQNLAAILLTWICLFDQIRDWQISLKSYSPFRSIVEGLVRSNLRDPLLRLFAFEQGYAMELESGKLLSRPLFYQEFNRAFNLPNLTSAADRTPLQGTRFAARTELDRIFQILFQNYRQIVQQASHYLSPSLEAQQDHPPHLALYLAFWEVLKPARNDLNRMTQRHLDFFYQEVLRFQEKPVQPDRAHLLFELAKFEPEYKLVKNTLFTAGKDASGAELNYELDEDTVIHRAQVAKLQGLLLSSLELDIGNPVRLTGLHASIAANSFDGKGAEFPKDQVVKAWQPFGDPARPPAEIGLAIVSNLLLLQEGTRKIVIELDLQKKSSDQVLSAPPKLADLNPGQLSQLFRARLSGEKDWINASTLTATLSTPTGTTVNRLTLTLTIDRNQPAVISYHADLTNPVLPATDQPVLLLELNSLLLEVVSPRNGRIDRLSPYHFLRSLNLTRLTLEVQVDDVRDLIVQNNLSVLDGTKPFQPFSSQPRIGSNFYIGSQEVFQKPLTELGIKFTLEQERPGKWSEIYAAYGVNEKDELNEKTFNPGLLKVEALRQKDWNSEGKAINLFDKQLSLLNSQLENLKLQTSTKVDQLEEWTPQSQNGFLRLQLTTSFLHEQYATVLARQILAAATTEIFDENNVKQRKAVIGAYYRNSDEGIFPANTYSVPANSEPLTAQEPYTPVFTSLSLTYKAKADYILSSASNNNQQNNQQTDIQLFHLFPFSGFNPIVPSPIVPLSSISFLPEFRDEGTLYIGIQDLNPPTALPLLIQVAEETADTDLPRTEVQWSYLANNQWYPLGDYQVIRDATNGLITSGIVDLAIPATITRENTILSPDLYWLKVAVAERSGAVCHIIGIHTQAALVTFHDRGNDPAHLTQPLPKGTIAKLADPQPEIKALEQPYDSFGGQGKERPEQYAVRVSESLRHKGRAVTIFDYERLVLERYPEIYKVRCINHGQINDHISPTQRDNLQELVPGSVTIAVIPDLSYRSTSNDLQPKVNVNLLEEIRQYLKNLSSPWVEIDVVNPRYEEIQVEFDVQFKPPYSGNFGYYQRELQRAIIGFLSPWTIDRGAEIHFGGRVYRSSILNFVEEQPYVDYVLNFQMHRDRQRNLQDVVASSARSILVSVPFPDSSSDPSRSSTGHLIHPAKGCPVNRPTHAKVLGYDRLDQLTLE